MALVLLLVCSVFGIGGRARGAAPSPPTTVRATAGYTQIILTWIGSTDATSYDVYRGTSSGDENPIPIATGIAITSCTDTGLTNGSTYYYTVAAVDASGTSAYSTEVSAIPAVPIPTAVTVTTGSSQLTLNWASASGVISYLVYRGASSGGEISPPIAIGITGTSYTDTGLTNGTTYYYTVAAIYSTGTSGYSAEVAAKPVASGGPADINLAGYTLAFDDEFNTLSLSTTSPKGAANWYAYPPNGASGWFSESAWNPNALSVSNGILSEEMYYSGGWQSGYVASVDPTCAGFSQTYGYFEIRCEMPNAGDGAWPAFWLDSTAGITGGQGNEEVDIFEWFGICDTPGADYNLIQETSHNWNTDGTQNTTTAPYLQSSSAVMPCGQYPWLGYHIYGCQIDPGHMTWYIDGIKTNECATPTPYLATPFYIMVNYAIGGGWPLDGAPFTTDGTSTFLVDWIRVYSLPTTGIPWSPSMLTGSAGNTEVSLNWNASGSATTYNVYRGTSAGGEKPTPVAVGITGTNYVDTGLANFETYYYTVSAVNSSGTSEYSNEISARPSTGDIDLTGYVMTFDDEFNSLSVSGSNPKGSANWYSAPANGVPMNGSVSAWNSGAFSVSNGILSDQAWYVTPAVGGTNWQSGILSSVDASKTGFTQMYGYYEIRCEMPNAGEGAWPSFWLDGTLGMTGTAAHAEVDIFQWYGVCNTAGSYQDYVCQRTHNWNADGSENSTTAPRLNEPMTSMPTGQYPWLGYHIYGCQVDPTNITWFVDGVETNQIATPASYLTSPFYISVDYALGGWWPLSGAPFTTNGASSLLVDWVRVYSLPSVFEPVTYSQWATTKFVGSSGNTGETATPQNDGISNLEKYLFDINPAVPMKASDWAALPAAGMTTVGGSPYLTLTYRQNTSESGLTVNVQTSSDLQTWLTVTPANTLSVGTDSATGDPLIQDQVPVSPQGASKEFIRLDVIGP